MVVRLIAVGRVRDPGLRQACNRYVARVRRCFRFEMVEVRGRGVGDRNPAHTRRIEADGIRRAVLPGSRLVALTRHGDTLSSQQWATRLGTWRESAQDVAIVIGGAHGLDPEFLAGATERLSLSALTFPHELARLVALEQLYRAATIRRGEPYHKGTFK